jgi:hypothetical protein
MKRIVVVTLACIALTACGQGKPLSGKFFIQNDTGSPSSIEFLPNGTAALETANGVVQGTYQLNGTQVSVNAPMLAGGYPSSVVTYSLAGTGCLVSVGPNPVQWCSKPYVDPYLNQELHRYDH